MTAAKAGLLRRGRDDPASGIVGEHHGRAAYHEHVGDHAPLDQTLAKGGERPLKLYPVEEDAPRLGHAACRSAADR